MSTRFALYRHYLPEWFPYAWCFGFLLVGIGFVAGLVAEIGLFGLAGILGMVGGMLILYTFMKQLSDPSRNYVELADQSFDIVFDRPMFFHRRSFEYRQVVGVAVSSSHPLIPFVPWLLDSGNQTHVDVRIKNRFIPRIWTMHLYTDRSHDMATELRDRAKAGTPEAPIA